MKIAVFGCLHGMLNEMYQAVADYEKTNNQDVDFIIVCGDCQTIRHYDDLKCLAVPNKYKRLGDFHEYYSGKKKIPKLTICIGGNHEASNYLMTLPYGGWLCDNFYYLGYAGVINYKGLRIAGVSGIYNSHNCHRGRFESMPLNDSTLRSAYHSRNIDVFRLQLLSNSCMNNNPIDIFMSHDWPARIYDHGDLQQLLRFKPLFRQDVESKEGLGSPLTAPLVHKLQPKRWFAAHLHCRFYAKVKHDNPLDQDDDKESTRCTEFLSLNKIEKGRRFVEFIDMLPDSQNKSKEKEQTSEIGQDETASSRKVSECEQIDDNIYYDAEWLTILRKTVELEESTDRFAPCPSSEEQYQLTEESILETRNMMQGTGGMIIEKNFEMSEPVVYNRSDGSPASQDGNRTIYFPNPQHERLCMRLQIKSKFNQPSDQDDRSAMTSGRLETRNHEKFSRRTSYRQYNNRGNNYQDRGYRQPYSGPSYRRGGGDRSHRRGSRGRYQARGSYRDNPDTGHFTQPVKKIAYELDEDGCLPCYVDKKGEP